MHRTNIELDENLVAEALEVTRIKTKKKLVDYALRHLVSKIKRKKLLDVEGKVEWTGNLNEMRKSRV